MKILFNHYKYYTEVLFPLLAVQYGWPIIYDKQIQWVICQHIGIKPPWHPARTVTHPRKLREVVRLCRKIENDPTLFFSLAV